MPGCEIDERISSPFILIATARSAYASSSVSAREEAVSGHDAHRRRCTAKTQHAGAFQVRDQTLAENRFAFHPVRFAFAAEVRSSRDGKERHEPADIE